MALREIGVNGRTDGRTTDGRTDGQTTEKHNACWRRGIGRISQTLTQWS